jgi:hypothetical protein
MLRASSENVYENRNLSCRGRPARAWRGHLGLAFPRRARPWHSRTSCPRHVFIHVLRRSRRTWPPNRRRSLQPKKKRRFRGKANRPLPSSRQLWTGPGDLLRPWGRMIIRPYQALRARKTSGRTGHKRSRTCLLRGAAIGMGRRRRPLVGGSSRISAHAGPPWALTHAVDRPARSDHSPCRDKDNPPLP